MEKLTPYQMTADPFEKPRFVAIIPRWSVMPVIRRQTNGEHIFLVARYAAELVERHEIKEIPLQDVLMYALEHDDAEAIHGDLPSPSPLKDGKDRSIESKYDPLVIAIVKAADRTEALYYITEEIRLGSTFAADMEGQVSFSAQEAYDDLVKLLAERRQISV